MQFCTAVLPADICHLACAEGWMSKVWTITLTVGAVLYARSIFLLSRQWQLDHLASAATPKLQTQNYFQMPDFLDPSKIS